MKTTNPYEEFKSRFIYPLNDNRFPELCFGNDYNSAGFICNLSSLVLSIIELKDQCLMQPKKNNEFIRYIQGMINKTDATEVFRCRRNLVLLGYSNCCFIWDGEKAAKYQEELPIYCDYISQRTDGLPMYRFNPYLHIWVRALQTVFYQQMCVNNPSGADAINKLLEAFGFDEDLPYLTPHLGADSVNNFNPALNLIHYIRKEANHALVMSEIRNFKSGPERNRKSAEKYINDLFDIYSKLLVVRIDISYRDSEKVKVSVDRIRADRNRFFNNMRHNQLFKNRVGFISKLEYGLDKGWHYHLILFFNGAKVQNDWYLAKRICSYWRESITHGKGVAFNCHDKISDYKYKGIGKIAYKDVEMRANLINYVSKYLIKPDLFARVIPPVTGGRHHVFERGQQPVRISKSGRPRLGP